MNRLSRRAADEKPSHKQPNLLLKVGANIRPALTIFLACYSRFFRRRSGSDVNELCMLLLHWQESECLQDVEILRILKGLLSPEEMSKITFHTELIARLSGLVSQAVKTRKAKEQTARHQRSQRGVTKSNLSERYSRGIGDMN